jgi:hypothetical protein
VGSPENVMAYAGTLGTFVVCGVFGLLYFYVRHKFTILLRFLPNEVYIFAILFILNVILSVPLAFALSWLFHWNGVYKMSVTGGSVASIPVPIPLNGPQSYNSLADGTYISQYEFRSSNSASGLDTLFVPIVANMSAWSISGNPANLTIWVVNVVSTATASSQPIKNFFSGLVFSRSLSSLEVMPSWKSDVLAGYSKLRAKWNTTLAPDRVNFMYAGDYAKESYDIYYTLSMRSIWAAVAFEIVFILLMFAPYCSLCAEDDLPHASGQDAKQNGTDVDLEASSENLLGADQSPREEKPQLLEKLSA